MPNKKKQSQNFRCDNFDYHSRSMYLLTFNIEGRRQLLGHLEGDPSLPNGSEGCAHLVPSALGKAVEEEWKNIPALYPQIKNMVLQLMPDHLHTIIFVESELPKNRPVGTIMAIFKAHCRQRYEELIKQGLAPAIPQYILDEQEAAKRENRKATLGKLFEIGFNDKILWKQGELRRWQAYLTDNPRRRLLKELNLHFFTVKHNVKAGGFSFEAMGNEFLLSYPRRLFVQCSRRLTDNDIKAIIESLEKDFQSGSAFVSACISNGEKLIMRTAFNRHCPVVILLENGFGPYYKPGGKSFDSCAEGRMLLLAPWQYHPDRRTITREQCLALNNMGEAISTEKIRTVQ